MDDDAIDRQLIGYAFGRADADVTLHECDGGRDALDFINGAGRHVGAKRPHACLLDVKMPDVSGIEVLKAIKQDPKARSIQVVMISSSDRNADVDACYKNHANGYVCKPLKSADLNKTIRALSNLWINVYRLPT
ncbi:MAG: response regulator [Parvularculaceae bacterium]